MTPAREPGPPDRWDTSGFEPVLDDRFEDGLPAHWLPYHLPHWSSRASAAARYSTGESGLVLRIDPDQPPWCPEWDGGTRVSNLQSGLFAGPLGSRAGQHRFRPGVVVREEQETFRGHLQLHGLVEVTMAASTDPDAMTALWMVGLEETPEESGEICVCEVFGRDAGTGGAAVGMGVHPFGDPALEDDFDAPRLPIDIAEPHTYGVRWEPDRVGFYVDGALVRVVGQSPRYPLQLMLGLYDLAGPDPRDPARRPRATVGRLRAYRPAGPPG